MMVREMSRFKIPIPATFLSYRLCVVWFRNVLSSHSQTYCKLRKAGTNSFSFVTITLILMVAGWL